MLGGIGGQELLLIFLGILLIFGGKKLPELARGLGKGIKEFKKATQEIESDLDTNSLEDKNQKKQ
ncbi:twin-arginine translocase TatA/TatE family subunit [candidate division KSB1 bacterium]